ncbi:hypothetical protein P168DRAFT_285561 [Aspergillus campestris IBT 28561]|uniref:Lysine-specific metallo-endopeptidase domain-containing protein n=1 Tax=Aspergillus campestris (strain IBT 28561) TaxID=1392248 RepID=A0A2I1CQZ6_ASPC2|nr:uncharacterized protein P168DRAFT_285561 [Aspergillus campestris IBT 28561]PKY00046.1 hypothetical protein P168DRAFT_285561 [Aspergillus campestris IBT 28561]
MRFLKALSCLLGLAGLASAGEGWKLDESCKTDAIGSMVTDAIQSAFNMASDELDAIDKALNNEDLGENGENIRNVLKWMFMKDGEEPNGNRLGLLRTNLRRLLRAREEITDGDPDDQTIVVYCGLDRFEEREDGLWYDKDIDDVLEKDESFGACKGAEPTVAYVLVSPGNTPSQLQLCPWFIEWMQGINIKNVHKVDKKSVFWKILSKGLVKMKAVLTPMDVASLLDKVILHELTHTRNAGESDDVDGPSFKTVKYTWKRCRELAREGPDDVQRESQVNADSIALAGSAIRFIKEGNEVKEDGSIVKR